jgi:hypothetical protein
MVSTFTSVDVQTAEARPGFHTERVEGCFIVSSLEAGSARDGAPRPSRCFLHSGAAI